MSAKCSSCGAAIIWTVTEKGRPMPVDAVPNLLLGNIALSDSDDPREAPTARVVKKGESGSFTSHFATCEFAAQHRKGKR